MVTNYELRRKAHKALKTCFPIVLLAALITALPGLIAQLIVILTDSSWQTYMLTLMLDMESVMYTGTVGQLTESFAAFAQDKGWINAITDVFSFAAAPVLQLGLIHCLLVMLRGGEVRTGLVFSRLGSFWRALLLALLTLGKTLLWMLPGLAVSVGGAFLTLLSPEAGLALTYAGSIAALVLVVRASYAYAMAPYVQADAPDTPVRTCIARSKQLMLGRRMQLFSLEMLYIGWTLLANMITMSLSGVIGSTVSMVLQLVISVYMNAARCSFYEHHSKEA